MENTDKQLSNEGEYSPQVYEYSDEKTNIQVIDEESYESDMGAKLNTVSAVFQGNIHEYLDSKFIPVRSNIKNNRYQNIDELDEALTEVKIY